MGNRCSRVTTALLLVCAVSPALTGEKGGDGVTDPYEVVANWPQNPCGEGYPFGSTSGIFAESPDRVFIFQRGGLLVLEERPLLASSR